MPALNFSSAPVTRRFPPFPYQADFDAQTSRAFEEFDRVLAVLPTGGGKTFCAGEQIAKRVEKGQRCLALAHTTKLVSQFCNAVADQYGIHATIESGSRTSEESPLVVATIQSMVNRIRKGDKRFHAEEFDLLVIDEAHRILSPGYREALSHFKGKVLGITATPRRTDQRSLMSFFQAKSIDVPLHRLIEEGFLAPIHIENFPLSIQLKAASKTGDITEEEVAHAIEPYLDACADELVKWKGRCMLAFLPLIETSKKFCAMLNNRGLRAAHVDGEMKERQADEIKMKLERGDLDIVCNSMLWTEGVDIRPVSLILNLRPTKSWVLYTQICGRGTRTFDPAKHGVSGCQWGVKKDIVLLDPLWLCDEHSLIQRPASLVSLDDEMQEEMARKIKEKQDEDGLDAMLDLMEVRQSVMNDREESLRKRLERMAERKRRQVNAMELFLEMQRPDLADYQPIAEWESEKVTDGQRQILINNNVDLDSITGKGHASVVIDAIIGRMKDGKATLKMAKYAAQLGLVDAYNQPFDFVGQYISKAKEGKLDGIPE